MSEEAVVTAETQDTGIGQTYNRKLKCNLTPREVDRKKEDHIAVLNEQDRVRGDMEQAAKAYKEQKAKLEAELAGLERDERILRTEVNDKVAYREVPCMDIPNKGTNEIEVHRLDVHEDDARRIVARRPMNLLEASEITEDQIEEIKAMGDAVTAELKPAKRGRKKGNGKAESEPEAETSAETGPDDDETEAPADLTGEEPDYSLPVSASITEQDTARMAV